MTKNEQIMSTTMPSSDPPQAIEAVTYVVAEPSSSSKSMTTTARTTTSSSSSPPPPILPPLPPPPAEADTYYHNGEIATIRTVLRLLETSETRKYQEGLRERNFTLGVLNCFLVAYTFGRYPQHFWLLYFIEALILLPLRWYQLWNAKPLNQALYYLDYCWIMNMIGCLVLLLLLQDAFTFPGMELISPTVRRHVFMTFTGICCGPLMGANYVLPFVALRFHDLVHMSAVFIHLMPPMAMYTLLWHGKEISTAWPDLFHLNYFQEVTFFPKNQGMLFFPGSGLGSIAGNAVALYWIWFIPYVSWMLLVGLGLPRRRGSEKQPFDTVFHSTLRGGICLSLGKLWGRPETTSRQQMIDNTYEVRDFAVYMAVHAIFTNLALYVFGYLCYEYRIVHGTTLCFMVVVCVYRGGRSYRQWASRTAFLIEKEFAPVILEIQNREEEEAAVLLLRENTKK